MIFANRKQAGRLLSDKLLQYKNENLVVFALPRGGVPVACEIAEVLSAPLEVLVVRKIGHPFMPELAVGAICEAGVPLWNDAILARLGLDPNDLLATVKREQRRIDQQIEMFRGGRPLFSPKGKVAILVDDGLATGATVLAAVAFLKREKAKSIILAIPVAAASSAREVRAQVDELIALEEPEEFRSVGEWYGDFDQVSEAEVILALNAFATKQPKDHGPSKQAAEWFREYLGNGKISLKERSRLTLDQVTESEMVAVKSERDFERLIQSLKDVRVVMLGEASHGTKEFYQIRSYLSQRLMQEHGFSFVAVEGDWPDAHRLNQYIKTGEGGSAEKVLMHNHRWPTWMWANDEVVALAEWMRKHGGGFYGLDVYSLFESIDEVVKFVKSKDMSLASEIEKRYACFNSYEGDEIRYARSLLEYPPGCESEVLSNLQKVLNLRVGNGARDEEALFSTQQNARVVANAESYYRAMLSGDASSWNVRDSHMMETLDRLLERHGKESKAIVWAHNTHIGDYRATDMVDAGYVNLGGLARQCYGDEAVALVGFGTYQGEVLAGAAWGRAEQVMELPTAREESYEHHFHTVAEKHNLNQFYLLLEDQARSVFAQQLGHRAVGVVYDPKHERRGNYVPTVLSKRYDAFVFVDKTHALQSLHAVPVQGEFPDTWPSGV